MASSREDVRDVAIRFATHVARHRSPDRLRAIAVQAGIALRRGELDGYTRVIELARLVVEEEEKRAKKMSGGSAA